MRLRTSIAAFSAGFHFTKAALFARKCHQTPAVKEPLPENGNSGKVKPKS
jgi:hypothetical protein